MCLQCDVSNNAVHGHFVIFTGAPATFSRLAMMDFFSLKNTQGKIKLEENGLTFGELEIAWYVSHIFNDLLILVLIVEQSR